MSETQPRASDRLNGLLEDNAGTILFVVVVALGLVLSIKAEIPVALALFSGCTVAFVGVLLFTRELRTDANVRALFRFAYLFSVFALAGTVMPFMYLHEPLYLGQSVASEEPPSSECRKPSSTPEPERRCEPASSCQENGAPPATVEPPKPDTAGDSPDPARMSCKDGTEKPRANDRPVPTAIALLQGCPFSDATIEIKDASGKVTKYENARVPSGVIERCGVFPPQWVVSVGGAVIPCAANGTCDPCPSGDCGSADALESEIAQAKAALAAKQKQANAAASEVGTSFNRVSGANGERYVGQYTQALAKQKALGSEIAQLQASVAKQTTELARLTRDPSKLEDHIGGLIVTGGLVVPLYFVVLALLGASVAMFRKLPEFQHRSMPSYREEFLALPEGDRDPKRNPISSAEARELLIFQLMQVASAVPIAFVAWSWVRPEDDAQSAVLGFAAGLSSEVFLMAIRSLVDRLVGLGLRPPLRRVAGSRAAGVAAPTAAAAAVAPKKPPRQSLADTNASIAVGDRVQLAQRISYFLPGSIGVVREIKANGDLEVELEKAHDGSQARALLAPKDRSFFAAATATLEPAPTEAVG